MNVLKFYKILREEAFTASLINSLYKNEKQAKFILHRNLDDLIRKNYKIIIENKYPDSLPFILNELYKRDSLKNFIRENMLFNLMMASNSEFAIIIKNDYGIDWVEYIESNIDELLEKIGCQKVQKFVFFSSRLSSKTKTKINEYLNKEKQKYVEYLLFGKLKEYVSTTEYNDLLFLMVKLVEEVLNHEEKEFFDIVKKKSGHYSEVIEIGTKIIKLIHNQMTYMIPYDKRLLMPIIRMNLSTISNLDVVLEVTEKVDCDSFIYKKNLISLYNDMRRRGIVFGDMKVENVGILLRENRPHWNKKICDELLNKGIYKDNMDEIVLQAGDKVIVDLDYVYDDKSEEIKWANSNCKEFELRYKENDNCRINCNKQKIKKKNK